MPRLYVKISRIERRYKKETNSTEEVLYFRWLRPAPVNADEKKWHEAGLPVSCGLFKTDGNKIDKCDKVVFPHLVSSFQEYVTQKVLFELYPQAGEVWAVYKDWKPFDWCSDPKTRKECKFLLVETLTDYSPAAGVNVASLGKVAGYSTIFRRTGLSYQIAASKLFGFSHNIPVRSTGDMKGLFAGTVLDLDQLSIPKDVVVDTVAAEFRYILIFTLKIKGYQTSKTPASAALGSFFSFLLLLLLHVASLDEGMGRVEMEAVVRISVALILMKHNSYVGAREKLIEAITPYPGLEYVDELIKVCDIICASGSQGNGVDWCSVLEIDKTTDESEIDLKYAELLSTLEPVKSKFQDIQSALGLVEKAYSAFKDREKLSESDSRGDAILSPCGSAKPLDVAHSETMDINGGSTSQGSSGTKRNVRDEICNPEEQPSKWVRSLGRDDFEVIAETQSLDNLIGKGCGQEASSGTSQIKTTLNEVEGYLGR
ncbi:hypothetical protein MKX03_015855 [Papaver bracteatum]|nr:hypothetical protein MKX03_015855 [Papaver bracteatum]